MVGRKRIPIEKKEILGTVRARDRKKAEGTPKVPVVQVEECPGLSPKAKEYWPFIRQALQKLPVSTEADIVAIQRLAECYAEVRVLQETCRLEGRFYESATKEGVIVRAHPAVGALSEADRRLRAYLTDFGLTPASRTRVKGDGNGDTPKDPLIEFGI